MSRIALAVFAVAAVISANSASVVAAGAPRTLVFSFDADGALPAGWKAADDRWRVAGGQLFVDATEGESYVVFGDDAWRNYEIDVTVTFDAVRDGTRWAAVVFRAGEPGKAPWSQCPIRFRSSGSGGVEFAVRTAEGPWSVRHAAKLKDDCRLGVARKLRVVVRGTRVEAFVDGKSVIDSAYCVERSTGRVGLGASGCRVRFDNLCVRPLPPSETREMKPLKRCEVVAHRGFSAVAPENTLVAIDRAVRAGATGSEFDVYACKDGPIVLMHDATVDRTTNGRGRVTELTLAELRRLDAGSWLAAEYAGEKVPTLDEALARLKGTGCIAVVEIKMEGISRPVIEAIEAAKMRDESAVIAFSANVVREVRALRPELPCAWLCHKDLTGTPAQRADALARELRDCGTDLIDVHFSMLSEEIIAELHDRGIRVWTWTVDDPAVMEALMRWGVDSITTNRPDLVVELQRRSANQTGSGITP
ncbi:MAG: hypothetical protein JW809_05010 [Pirellulales bacterium]|nr:hypothetical protein [Pirellulales bacterium]